MIATPDIFKVCIICTTYNHELYIESALRGFVMQETSFPFVVVIIDDASTDSTAKVTNLFFENHFSHQERDIAQDIKTKDCFVTFGQHKTNRNCFFVVVRLTINHYSRGLSKKQYCFDWMKNASYLALCEGDDYWTDPLKLQKQVDFLEYHDDYVMCCTAFSQTENGDEEHKSNIYFDLNDITLDNILREQWIGTLTTVFRKEAIRDYRVPFPDLPMGDLPLWGFLATKGRIKYLKDITANYRRLNSSACHFTNPQKQFEFQIEAMRVREYYALAENRVSVASPFFKKNAHYIFEQVYRNKWLDFPMEKLWHFMLNYGKISGYDKLKYWGLKSEGNYFLSRKVLHILKKG